jgi:hypothetical protein
MLIKRDRRPTVPGSFLKAVDLQSTDKQSSFSCSASVLGLQRGHFPGTIETDAGNGSTFHMDRAVFDERGNFVGIAYRQVGGCEVLVLAD